MIAPTDKEFLQLADYIKDNYGINLMEKKALVTGRLTNLVANNFSSFADYIQHIFADKTGESMVTLINKLTTNHTFFLREAAHFDYFKLTVLPYLTRNAPDHDLRIWSAGCSTGEEPYTLAMIMADYFGEKKIFWDTKILATDISQKALNTALQGIYTNEQIKPLPMEWKRNYFKAIDQERSGVVDPIRNEVVFRSLNLMNPVFPFKKRFHVIFCRNVMIYFDEPTKRELVDRFYEVTEPGGYLFIGHSETLTRNETRYRSIIPAVYRKE